MRHAVQSVAQQHRRADHRAMMSSTIRRSRSAMSVALATANQRGLIVTAVSAQRRGVGRR